MYEISIEYAKISSYVNIVTDGKHAATGFVIDALDNHENGKFTINSIKIVPVNNVQVPVSLSVTET